MASSELAQMWTKAWIRDVDFKQLAFKLLGWCVRAFTGASTNTRYNIKLTSFHFSVVVTDYCTSSLKSLEASNSPLVTPWCYKLLASHMVSPPAKPTAGSTVMQAAHRSTNSFSVMQLPRQTSDISLRFCDLVSFQNVYEKIPGILESIIKAAIGCTCWISSNQFNNLVFRLLRSRSEKECGL